MSDIINLLPDNIANQIAAGEVIQRPASIVKELMENSVDAQSKNITVNIVDAGRTLIQISDDGIGMSETDARMAFERHATSKIKKADDIFAIHTMGFRGEALASIVAVAEVDITTRQESKELATHLNLKASKVISQEHVVRNIGTDIAVRNLFFNIPARRKFLKANSTEFRHIATQFQRIAIAYPSISFKLIHNESTIWNLKQETIKSRIIHTIGKHLNNQLVNIEEQTELAKISGFIGTPSKAKKSSGEQYMYVNNRFIKHSYFHRAILEGYKNVIASDMYPSYFIHLEVDPSTIDVNIHPTKTEVKFENEPVLWSVIQASVRKVLSQNAIVPSIEFDTRGKIPLPLPPKEKKLSSPPPIKVNETYNPFEKNSFNSAKNWEKLYENDNPPPPLPSSYTDEEVNISPPSKTKNIEVAEEVKEFIQWEQYIVCQQAKQLCIIHKRLAHIQVLYEYFLEQIQKKEKLLGQRLVFPIELSLNEEDKMVLFEEKTTLNNLGFFFEKDENTVKLTSICVSLKENPALFIQAFIEDCKQGMQEKNFNERTNKIAKSLAQASAMSAFDTLSTDETVKLLKDLANCNEQIYAPNGKTIQYTLTSSMSGIALQ